MTSRDITTTLGRTAFVLLRRGARAEQDRELWRGAGARYQVARTATSPDSAQRYPSVAVLHRAWQAASTWP